MGRLTVVALAAASMILSPPAPAKGSGGHHNREAGTHGHSKADPGVTRDEHGKIAWSEKARAEFRNSHPCPSTGKTRGACPGYVIDHVQALKHGGTLFAARSVRQFHGRVVRGDASRAVTEEILPILEPRDPRLRSRPSCVAANACRRPRGPDEYTQESCWVKGPNWPIACQHFERVQRGFRKHAH